MIVVADLGTLFNRVLVPEAVAAELANARTPEPVKLWMTHWPDWIEICPPVPGRMGVHDLDERERQAIELARYLRISLLLIDDAGGRVEAQSCGLEVLGTVGILERGAELGLLDFAQAFAELKKTNFHMSASFRQLISERHHLDP